MEEEPTMNYIVNVSGGLTSFEALRRVIAREGNGTNVIPIFANTRIEEPDLYRFLGDTERLLDITIIRLADGRTPFDVMKDERAITIRGIAPCSKKLKREVIERFVRTIQKPFTMVYGLDWSEMHRITRMRELSKDLLWFPLIEKPLVTKADIITYLHAVGIQETQAYKDGFSHNNCGGGCVKAGKRQFIHLLQTRPDTYAFWEAGEQDVRAYLGKDVTILKSKQTLRQVREDVERGAVICDDEDESVCGCMTALFQAEMGV
jgi:3'-phosphoadenosine 5'-phosphosulfate sulfotransferase (PAPS reductase)/FAD synthetase